MKQDPTPLLMLVAGHESAANTITLGPLARWWCPGRLALPRGTVDPAFVANAVKELPRHLGARRPLCRQVAIEDVEPWQVIAQARHDPGQRREQPRPVLDVTAGGGKSGRTVLLEATPGVDIHRVR